MSLCILQLANFTFHGNFQQNAQQLQHKHHPNPVNLIIFIQPGVNKLVNITPREFYPAKHLYPHQYHELHSILEPFLTQPIPTNKAISSNTKIQAALCYLATGDNLTSSVRSCGMSNASQLQHLNATPNALICEVIIKVFMKAKTTTVHNKVFLSNEKKTLLMAI